jgi:hypothetical protein
MNDRPVPLRPDPAALNRADRRSLHRAITAMALSTDVGSRSAEAVLRRTWPNDTTAQTVLKAAVSPTTTSIYPTAIVSNPLVTLAPESAAAQLFAECLHVDLTGVTSVRLPYVAGAPQPGFIAELAPAPVAQLSVSNVEIGPAKKILILAGLTGELENAHPTAVSTMIGRALADATTKSVDAAAFSNIAGDAVRPPGLLYAVTPLTAATAGGSDLETLAADLASLANAIAAANINPVGMVLIASWKQATKLSLLSGQRFENLIVGTSALADRTVVAVAPGAVGFGYLGTPEISVSKEATVHFEDTTPLAIGTPGSPNTIAAPTRSAFQSDMFVVKVRARCAWDNLPGSVQVVNLVNW